MSQPLLCNSLRIVFAIDYGPRARVALYRAQKRIKKKKPREA